MSLRSTANTRRARTKGKRPRNRRRFNVRRLLLPLVMIVIASCMGAGIHSILTNPKLRIETIIVTGPRLVPAPVLKADAAIALGRNILTVSGKSVVSRVMKHPEVREVTVGRRLPRTLVVKVVEKTPYFVLANGKGFWLVDKDGMPFHRVSKTIAKIPVVQIPAEVEVATGRKMTNHCLEYAIACMQASPSLTPRITKISVDRAANVCLNMGSGFYVKLGQPVEIQEKMTELSRILAAQPEIGNKVEYINMGCYQAPAIKLKSAAEQKIVPRNT
jgi:cell division protein FtsQ